MFSCLPKLSGRYSMYDADTHIGISNENITGAGWLTRLFRTHESFECVILLQLDDDNDNWA